jgi:aldehyde dehydrogenase (NAD+)
MVVDLLRQTGIVSAQPSHALVGGGRLPSLDTFPVLDPATGEVIALVGRGGAEEIDAAVVAARSAFATWRNTTADHRGRLLRRLAQLMRRERTALAALESLDTGKPISQARNDVDVAARFYEFTGSVVEAFYGETILSNPDVLGYTLREPYGVTGHIIPWNYPLQILARTTAPALAVGNCTVVKPAEDAPLSTLRIAQLAVDAGFPPGALNVVPGFGAEAGAALAAHPDVDHLAFTGSVAVGRLIAGAAAKRPIPVTLELGGKSPNIVLPDADLDVALPVIVNAIIQNAGQTCSAGSRLLLHIDIHDQVVDAIASRFSKLTMGPGHADPDLGPLISARQRDEVRRFIDDARDDAELVVGGGVPDREDLRDGFFYEPTLLTRVDPAGALAQQEVFGPVLAVSSFSDVAEAVRMTNHCAYGLIAAVWTRDLETAHRLTREIEAGQVYVNGYGGGGGVEMPFGGYRQSGHGREKGFEALRGYTHTKSVMIRSWGERIT